MLLRILLFALVCLSFQAEAATLKIATLLPDGTSWMKAMRQAAATVKDRTQGRVKLKFYPGGVMGNDKSVLRKIRIGQLHGGAITGGGVASFYPDASVYNLPFIFRSFEEVEYVRERMDSTLIEGMLEKGFVSYGLSEAGFAYLMSKNPVSRFAELRQQKIWVPEGDDIALAVFKALDIAPVPLPLTDVLTGLQTDLINTVASPAMGAIALQWHTRLKHLVDIPITYLFGTLVISEKALKAISSTDKEILARVLNDTFTEINTQNRGDNQQALRALRNQGMQFILPPDSEVDPWRQLSEQAIEKQVSEGRISRSVYETLQQHLATYRSKL